MSTRVSRASLPVERDRVQCGSVKKRILQGFGLALVVASPMWLTMERPPNYLTFGVCVGLGILLLIQSHFSAESKPRGGR